MSPVVAGVLTAVAYAISTLASARASRMADPAAVVAGVMIVGTILLLPICLVATPLPGDPAAVPWAALGWSAIAGAANVVGLLLAYAAYRIGTVGVVSTIGSTEGAIAAVISVVAGQALAPGSGPALAVDRGRGRPGRSRRWARARGGRRNQPRTLAPGGRVDRHVRRSSWAPACTWPARPAPPCHRPG